MCPGPRGARESKNGAGPTVVPGDELGVFILNHLEELDDEIGRRLRPAHGDAPVAVSGKHGQPPRFEPPRFEARRGVRRRSCLFPTLVAQSSLTRHLVALALSR